MVTEKPCEYCGVLFYPLRRGMCKKHYARTMKHGSPERRHGHGLSPIELVKFHGWEVMDTGCWEYRGNIRSSGGYGRVTQRGKALVVTRVVYSEWVGPIPEGHLIRHKCDNPPCINPDHLETGTVRDNTRDMFERGRARPPRGEMQKHSILTEQTVREIRAMWSDGGKTQREMAEMFGVSVPTISSVIHRKRWAHVI